MAFALSPALLAFLPPSALRPPPSWTVLLSGDADGYLSPCGCTDPMQGGLRRRATVLREDERTIRLDNGSLSGGMDVQNRLKGETAARALDLSKIAGSNFTFRDARLSFGMGRVLQLDRLSGERLISTSVTPSPTAPLRPWRKAGPFLIGGATSRPEVLKATLGEAVSTPEQAAHRLADEATGRTLRPVLLFDGDREGAAALARAEPRLALVTYRSTGRPASSLDRVGGTALASPGERGKNVVRLGWNGEAFDAVTVVGLDPEVPNDPAAQSLYASYLREVDRLGLLDQAPHDDLKRYAGTSKCLPCHAQAAKVWKASGHAHAYPTLVRDGHGRDPECVPCHVVGTSTFGMIPKMAFRSTQITPNLANVGCESCHGAGAAHAASPWKAHLPKVGAAACKPCHTLENSPKFDFAKYWPRIRH